MASPRSARRLSEGLDWFGQGIADLPSDPVWGVPFMAGVLLFACSFLVCFFERERRLGRLGNALRWAVDSQMLVQAGSAAFAAVDLALLCLSGGPRQPCRHNIPSVSLTSSFPFLIPNLSRPNNLSLRSKSYAHSTSWVPKHAHHLKLARHKAIRNVLFDFPSSTITQAWRRICGQTERHWYRLTKRSIAVVFKRDCPEASGKAVSEAKTRQCIYSRQKAWVPVTEEDDCWTRVPSCRERERERERANRMSHDFLQSGSSFSSWKGRMNMGRDRREPSLDGLNQRTQSCLSMMRVTERGGGDSSIMTTPEP